MAGNDTNTKLLLHANQGNTVKSAFAHMIMESNADSGSGANAVTDIGSPTYTAATGASQPTLGNAFTLDGSTDALNLNALADDIKTDSTGSAFAWVKVVDMTGSQRIFTITSDAADTEFYLQITTNALQASLVTVGVEQWNITASGISVNTWHHVGIVHNGVEARIYLDGVSVGAFGVTTDKTQWLNGMALIDRGRLGCRKVNGAPNDSFLEGQIDDFRYFSNSALSQTEVTALYNAGAGTQDSIIIDASTHDDLPFAHMALENNTDDGTGANFVGDIGNPTYTAATGASQPTLNNALTLDGSTDALNIDALQQDIASDTTGSVSLWFQATAIPASQVIWSFGDASANTIIRIRIATSQLRVDMNLAGPTQWRHESVVIAQATWHHIVLVQDGRSIKVYLDGVDTTNIIVSTDLTAWMASAPGLDNGLLGGSNFNSAGESDFFGGQIDDFRYYRTALTPTQVTNLYNSGTGTEIAATSGGKNLLIQTFADAQFQESAGGLQPVPDAESFGGYASFSSAQLTVPDSTDWDVFGSLTGDYTIDFWVRTDGISVAGEYILHQQNAGDTNESWDVQFQSDETFKIRATRTGGATVLSAVSSAIHIDTLWHHVAAIKVDADWAIYVDGVREGTGTQIATVSVAGLLNIGSTRTGSTNLGGDIDDMRISTTNVFSADPTSSDPITIPTIPAVGGAATRILLGNDLDVTTDTGVNTHTVTNVGSNVLWRPGGKWNSAALSFGVDAVFEGRLEIPYSSNWDIAADNTSDYTVDLQAAWLSDAAGNYLVSQRDDGNNRWFAILRTDRLLFRIVSGGTEIVDMNTDLNGDLFSTVSGEWKHYSFIKVGTSWGTYVDGVQIHYASNAVEASFSAKLFIGNQNSGASGFHGNLDEVRVQKSNYFLAAPNSFPAASLLIYGEDLQKSYLRLDGTANSFLDMPDSPDWAPGASDYTVDFWMRSSDSNDNFFMGQSNATGTGSTWSWQWRLNVGAQDKVRWIVGTSSAFAQTTSTTSVNDGEWHHIAGTVESGIVRLWVDGVEEDSTALLASPVNDSTNRLAIGRLGEVPFATTPYFPIDLDEIRVSKGLARFLTAGGSFTPSTVPYTSDGSTQLLLQFDEGVLVDNGNTGHTVSNGGAANQVAENEGFGADPIAVGTAGAQGPPNLNTNSSLSLDGNSDFFTIADLSGSDYDVVASLVDSWTIDLWVKPANAAAPSTETFLYQSSGGTGNDVWGLGRNVNESIVFQSFREPGLGNFGGAGNIVTPSGSVADTNWHHIAVIKSEERFGIYIDGIQSAYDTLTNTVAMTDDLWIGALDFPAMGASFFGGSMEQIQITKANKFGVIPLPEPFNHFKMNDNAANTTVDDVGTGNDDGTASVNTDTISVAGLADGNTALDFDGATSSNFVAIDGMASAVNADTTGTFMFWVKKNSFTDSSIFSWGNSAADTRISIQLGVGAGQGLTWFQTDTGSTNNFNSWDFTFVTDVWYHIAFIGNGVDKIRALVNGEDVFDNALPAFNGLWFAASVGLNVGDIGCRTRYNGNARADFSDNVVDDIRYYSNEVLSQTQVRQIYNSGSGTEEWGIL